MSEKNEIIIYDCRKCSNNQQNSHDRSNRSVQRHQESDSGKTLAAVGGFAAGIAAVVLLAAFSDDK